MITHFRPHLLHRLHSRAQRLPQHPPRLPGPHPLPQPEGGGLPHGGPSHQRRGPGRGGGLQWDAGREHSANTCYQDITSVWGPLCFPDLTHWAWQWPNNILIAPALSGSDLFCHLCQWNRKTRNPVLRVRIISARAIAPSSNELKVLIIVVILLLKSVLTAVRNWLITDVRLSTLGVHADGPDKHTGENILGLRKNIHVWIPLSYLGVIIFVRDWEKWLRSHHNLHIILVAVGTQLLTVNPITANHVNKHCSNVQFSSFTFYLVWTGPGQQTLTVCLGPLLTTITAHWEVWAPPAACSSGPALNQVFTGREGGMQEVIISDRTSHDSSPVTGQTNPFNCWLYISQDKGLDSSSCILNVFFMLCKFLTW